MPHSEVHKQKFKKNLAVLGMIVGFGLLIFAVTIIRISGG